MRDQVTWAFYVGNFTFLVGVAAAAVLLVVPAYVYHWKPMKEVVVLGELLAISALTMCLTFILVDMGRPDRLTHIIPGLGSPNWPSSLLSWDALVLNAYLVVNLSVAVHILYRAYRGQAYAKWFVVPVVLLSVPMAVGIHTVTAFLYNGMAARPFWNASILAPRFLASAFCSGPAVMIILFQILRKTTGLEIKDEAIWKVAELMAYAMFFNLFLLGAELFKEYYSKHRAPALHRVPVVRDRRARGRSCPTPGSRSRRAWWPSCSSSSPRPGRTGSPSTSAPFSSSPASTSRRGWGSSSPA